MKTLIVFLLVFASFYASAQSWQLGGSTYDTSHSGNSLLYKVYLTVSDDKGLPVTGLNATNFAASGEICHTGVNCDFISMPIAYLQNNILFREQLPGFYIMTFIFQSASLKTISSRRLLIRASSSEVNGYTKVLKQHAQILLQASSN